MAWSVGGEARTGLQVIWTQALARTFSVDRDSRESASQEGGRKEDVLGRNKDLGPHPWAPPGCPLSGEVVRLSRLGFYVSGGFPPEGRGGELPPLQATCEQTCLGKGMVATPSASISPSPG